MFAILVRMALRWTLAESEEAGTLFPDERVAERHVGKGAYAGMEFLHVNARTHHQHGAAGEPDALPATRSTRIEGAATPASTASPGRRTTTSASASATDFERKIVVKVNAVERLRAELRSPAWDGDHIAMGTNTDPYQHAEGKYHLTRGIVETLSGARQPVQHPDQVDAHPARRRAARGGVRSAPRCRCSFSIGTLDRVGVEADRARHSPARPPGRGAAPADRPGHLVRRAGGARCCRGSPTPRTQLTEVVEACAAAGAVSIHGVAAAPAWAAAGPLLRLARRRAARPGPPPPRPLPPRGVPGGRRAGTGGGHRAGGRPPVRRDRTVTAYRGQ